MGFFDWFFGRKSDSEPARPQAALGTLKLRHGDRVLARWFDTYYYPGQVRAIDGDRVQVAYDDGDGAWVHQANVRRPDVVAGSEVFCRANAGPAFLPGIVQKANGEKIQVRYDSGAEEWTTLSFIRVRRPVVDVGDDPVPLAVQTPAVPAPTGAVPPAAILGGPPVVTGPQGTLDVGEPRDDPNWRVGDRVLARWWDFFWYPGSLLGIGDKGFHVLFDDGDQRVVEELHLMALAVEEGEALFVRPKNQPQRIYMPATVTRVKGEVIDVDFEDGNSEANTRVSRARFWRCPVGYANFSFEEGDRVLGQDMDGFTYPAEIVSIDNDKVIVQFLDGPERMLTPELIRKFAIEVGMAVQCRWKGGQQYFPGRIAAVDKERMHVHYDDGDQEWTSVRLVRLPPR